jgi:H+-transporting ATPase
MKVAKTRATYGAGWWVADGEISSGKTTPPGRIFRGKFWSPIAWMLAVAALVEIGLGAHVETLVIAALPPFNATLGFVQESRATALAALKQRLAPTALVLRDGERVKLPAPRSSPATR